MNHAGSMEGGGGEAGAGRGGAGTTIRMNHGVVAYISLCYRPIAVDEDERVFPQTSDRVFPQMSAGGYDPPWERGDQDHAPRVRESIFGRARQSQLGLVGELAEPPSPEQLGWCDVSSPAAQHMLGSESDVVGAAWSASGVVGAGGTTSPLSASGVVGAGGTTSVGVESGGAAPARSLPAIAAREFNREIFAQVGGTGCFSEDFMEKGI